MGSFQYSDWSAGWCPSDSAIKGRPNGLLKMTGVELDTTGDLVMHGGYKSLTSAYSSNAHTLFSKFLGTTRFTYLAQADGVIRRDASSIKTGGSITRAAFGFAYDYVLAFSGVKRIRDDGSTTTDLGQVKASVPLTLASAGAGNLNGDYEYVQVNVFANGAYLAKSAVNTISEISVNDENVTVTAQNPTSPANEVWIFRRGGFLEQFYRVKRLTSSYNTPFTDDVDDQTALDTNVTLDLLAVSVNSTDLPDDILDVAGPINGRMIFFTKNTIYFSTVNSPESYVPGQGIPYSGNTNGSELFLWARKVGRKTVLVGTTKDIYVLNGTFITMPDGTLDVILDPLSTKYPPISLGVDVYNGGAVYISHDGWRVTYPDGSSELLIDDRIDRLYRGNTTYNTNTAPLIALGSGIPIYPYPATGPGGSIPKYLCAVARNKLFVYVPTITNNDPTAVFGSAFHVYDFKRNYWRVQNNFSLSAIYAEEDGVVIGFDSSDSKIKEIDYQFAKTLDGSSPNVDIIFPIWALNGDPFQRKDGQTLKLLIYTGATSSLSLRYSLDNGITFSTISTVSSTTFTEFVISLSALNPLRTIQLRLIGDCEDFRLTYIGIEYTERPKPVNYVRFLRWDGLKGQKFRPRVWPFVIDTLGSDVTLTPSMDGSSVAASTINTNGKRIHLHHFTTDVIGSDLGFVASGAGLFELYEVGDPEIVQVIPTAKKFDQVGPIDLFRYGKPKKFRLRLLSTSTANIAYVLYIDDTAVETLNISVTANKELIYEVDLGRHNGQMMRLEFGPTSFEFHRYYAEVQVAKQGKDTEQEWIPLESGTNG